MSNEMTNKPLRYPALSQQKGKQNRDGDGELQGMGGKHGV